MGECVKKNIRNYVFKMDFHPRKIRKRLISYTMTHKWIFMAQYPTTPEKLKFVAQSPTGHPHTQEEIKAHIKKLQMKKIIIESSILSKLSTEKSIFETNPKESRSIVLTKLIRLQKRYKP